MNDRVSIPRLPRPSAWTCCPLTQRPRIVPCPCFLIWTVDSSGDSVENLGGVRDTEWETQAKIVDGIVKQRLDASQLSESAREILLSMLHADPYERVLLRDLLQASATADGSRVRPSATECD